VNSLRIFPSYRPEAVARKITRIIPNHPTTYNGHLPNHDPPPLTYAQENYP